MPNRYINDTLTIGDLPDVPDFTDTAVASQPYTYTPTTWGQPEEPRDTVSTEAQELAMEASYRRMRESMVTVLSMPEPWYDESVVPRPSEWKCVNKDREKVMF